MEGAKLLDGAGIPLFAVCGNHDAETLPRLISDCGLDNIHLLGVDGQWERFVLETDSGILSLDGWSFPGRHYPGSPLKKYNLDKPHNDHVPIGIVHAELGGLESNYAPVDTAELHGTPHILWVLGHIHGRQIREQARQMVLYPGSPQPLDPGETGAHGPAVIEIDRSRNVQYRMMPVAALRYDDLDVDMREAGDVKGAYRCVYAAVEKYVETEALDDKVLDLVLLRLTLTGRCGAHSELVMRPDWLGDFSQSFGGAEVKLHRVEHMTKPVLDIERLAREQGPVGSLARLLKDIHSGKYPPSLIDEVTEDLQSIYRSSTYVDLHHADGVVQPPVAARAKRYLENTAYLLLDTLIKQKEAQV